MLIRVPAHGRHLQLRGWQWTMLRLICYLIVGFARGGVPSSSFFYINFITDKLWLQDKDWKDFNSYLVEEIHSGGKVRTEG